MINTAEVFYYRHFQRNPKQWIEINNQDQEGQDNKNENKKINQQEKNK